MNRRRISALCLLMAGFWLAALSAYAQEEGEPQEEVQLAAEAGDDRQTFVGKALSFDIGSSTLPPDTAIQEVLWNFGDGVRTTGEKVTHAYERAGTYPLTLTIRTEAGEAQDTATVQVFAHVAILLTDPSVPAEAVEVQRQRAIRDGVLLITLRPKDASSEVLIEEELTRQLVDVRDAVAVADRILAWTAGGTGANVLSKFAQHARQNREFSLTDLRMDSKGILLFSDTPFPVLAPTAQTTFDQLQPIYVLLTRPDALEFVLEPATPEGIREAILRSPISHRLFGAFSERTIRDIGVTNFFSFGINYLVNRGVPINSITLILMLPVIATILAFSRQVVGIKAFGIITPAMTTLSFLVIGLQYGLIVFFAVLLAGTFTRIILKKMRMLYLPRMALVLTSVSLAVLLLFGLGVASDNASILSFSIFPVLILTLLAEEFIAVQFSAGARQAFTITAWTLALSILCYVIVSWGLFRTLVLSYPEIILLTIPINIALGRFTGLRLTEYFRFRRLLRHVSLDR